MLPVRTRLIIPKDKWPLPGISGYNLRIFNWLQRLQGWMQAEAGVSFTFDYDVHICTKTHQELSTDSNGVDHRDPYGQGIYETHIWEGCFAQEMGLGTEVSGEWIFRWSAFVIGGGGWAGGRNTAHNCNHPLDNTGTSLIGDWQLSANVLGRCDPACIAIHSDSPVPANHPCAGDGNAWSHEMLHMFGVKCHGGDLLADGSILQYTTNPLAADAPHEPTANHLAKGQVMELFANSPRFLG